MSAAPAPGGTPPPRGGQLYVVRWRDRKGDTGSKLLRQGPAAERLAHRLRARGADPVVYVTRLDKWRPW